MCGGCAAPTRVDANLIVGSGLVLEEFDSFDVRIVDEEFEVVRERAIPGAQFESIALSVFDLAPLEVGQLYQLQIRGTGGACTALGRSPFFEHEAGPYTFSIQIGCADQFLATPSLPIEARIGQRVVTAPDGAGLIIGGTDEFNYENLTAGDFYNSIERYDPTTGVFTLLGATLNTPRVLPAVAPVTTQTPGIGIIGGVRSNAAPICASTTELIIGSSVVPGESLSQPRCLPSAALIADIDQIIVTGGAVRDQPGENDSETLEGDLEDNLAASIPGTVYRTNGVTVSLDGTEHGALVIGGTRSNPAIERVYFVPGDGFQSVEVTIEGWDTDGLQYMTATYVPCAGDDGGSVYVTGGTSTDDGVERGLNDVYCYHDDPSGGADGFHRIGRLDGGRRARHVAVLVDGPNSTQRLLLIGGTSAVDAESAEDPHNNGVMFAVTGCECPEAITGADFVTIGLPSTDHALAHDATVLGDGSVLLLYGAELPGSRMFEATGQAAIMIPDFGWDSP